MKRRLFIGILFILALYTLTDGDDENLWKTLGKTASGQIERYMTGDRLITRRSYNPENERLMEILTLNGNDTVQNYLYSYDKIANLASRTDVVHGMREDFTYDRLNRLTDIVEGLDTTARFDYDAYGRMLRKYMHSSLVFDSAVYNAGNRPHAIAQAKTREHLPRRDMQYTHFDRLARIEQDTLVLSYLYGYEHQRLHMTEANIYGDTLRQKEYVGNCEYIDHGTYTTTLTYLSGPLGVFGVQEDRAGYRPERYFIHPDHLGSWTLVTDICANVAQDVMYDTWGTPYRFTATGTEPDTALLFDRGFTGHEHLPCFGLINMNGRMYDSFTSSFLSVDNYVQNPDYTQGFNRYAYCLNNPLKYTDPDGEFYILDSWLSGFFQGFFSTNEDRLSNGRAKANLLATNDAKIWGGLFQTDANKGFFGRTWEFVSRFTWQVPQVFTGLGLSLAKNFVGAVDRVEYFEDVTYVINENWKKTGKQGVTLGNYINIDMNETIPNDISFTEYVLNDRVYKSTKFMHEYGHSIQSKRWGPLYLLSIGLPSLISAGLNGNSYNHRYFYTEVWANRRAQRHFSELYGTEWDYNHYPIEWEEQP